MSESLVNVANESWRDEIKRYNYRLDALTNLVDVISKLDLNVGYLWEKIEIDFDLYNSQSILPKSLNLQGSMVALQLLSYAQTNSRIVINVIKNIIKFWHSGLFVIVPLNTRFVFEIWGAIHFSKNTLKRLCFEGNIERERDRTDRLIFGSKKSEVLLPWSGFAEKNSFSVMEFIRSLKDVYYDSENLYDFLSEASHPNSFQNFYFLMAGPPDPNWGNLKFREHAHKLLDTTLIAIERVTKGIQFDLIEISEIGTSYIEKQCPVKA